MSLRRPEGLSKGTGIFRIIGLGKGGDRKIYRGEPAGIFIWGGSRNSTLEGNFITSSSTGEIFMDSLKSRRFFFLAAVTVLLVLFVSAPAGAGDLNWKLKGKYALTMTGTCASASCGFDMSKQVPGPWRILTPCPGPLGPTTPAIGISYNYAMQGDFSFDGQGNFEFVNGEVMSVILEPYRNAPQGAEAITYNNFISPIHHFESVGDGIYTVVLKGDELFVEILFENLTPPEQTVPNFKGATFRGRLTSSSTGSTVFLTSTSPAPENVLPSLTMQRICNAFGSMVKLSPQREVRGKD